MTHPQDCHNHQLEVIREVTTHTDNYICKHCMLPRVTLPKRTQSVLLALLKGEKYSDIMLSQHMSRSTVYYHIRKIAEALGIDKPDTPLHYKVRAAEQMKLHVLDEVVDAIFLKGIS